MKHKALNEAQREAVASSMESWIEGEKAFGYVFPDPVVARLRVAIDRLRSGKARDSDLTFGAVVITHMPYRRPEDRTIHSYRAAQRKIGWMSKFTMVGSTDYCDEQRHLFTRYIEKTIELEGETVQPVQTLQTHEAVLVYRKLKKELMDSRNFVNVLTSRRDRFVQDLARFLDECEAMRMATDRRR